MEQKTEQNLPGQEKSLSEYSAREKNQLLFDRQKELLDTFLANHAITRVQYEKSLGDLRKKMNISRS